MRPKVPRLWAWLLSVCWSLSISLTGVFVAVSWTGGSDVARATATGTSPGDEEKGPREAPAEPESSLSVLFLGNTHLGDNFKNEGQPAPKLTDHSGLRLHFGEMICQSDFAILNLETPLIEPPPKKNRADNKRYWSNAESAISLLEDLGVSSVALANDHVMDFGPKGLADTIAALDEAGISHVGAGLDLESASRPVYVDGTLGDLEFKMAVLAGSSKRPRSKKKRRNPPPDRPQTRNLALDELAEQIAVIKTAEPDRFVTVFPHWGPDYDWRDDAQQTSAHRLIDDGADLVLGQGSHMPQQIELYRRRWIVYGLGDFAFGTTDESPHRKRDLPYSLIARLYVATSDGELKHTLRLYPIFPASRSSENGGRPAEVKEVGRLLWSLLWRGYKDNRRLKRYLRVRRDQFGEYFEVMTSGAAPLPGKPR